MERRKFRNTKKSSAHTHFHNELSDSSTSSRLMSTVAPTLTRRGYPTQPTLPPPDSCTSLHLSHSTLHHHYYVDPGIEMAAVVLAEKKQVMDEPTRKRCMLRNNNSRKRAKKINCETESHDESNDGSGTTIAAVCGIDFVVGVTDGRTMDGYMGTVVSQKTVKTTLLCRFIYAMCAGHVAYIKKVTRRIHDHFKANSQLNPSVEEVAYMVMVEANRYDLEMENERKTGLEADRLEGPLPTCSYTVIGRHDSTKPCIFMVKKRENGVYEYTNEEEAFRGSGYDHAQREVDRHRDYISQLKRVTANAGGATGVRDILRQAVLRAARNDLHTDGSIHAVTITKTGNPLFEILDPMSGVVVDSFKPTEPKVIVL